MAADRHRPSAADDPFPPLGHHSQDALHGSHGVVTLGAYGRRLKVEGSAFNAREPDERVRGIDGSTRRGLCGEIRANAKPRPQSPFSEGKSRKRQAPPKIRTVRFRFGTDCAQAAFPSFDHEHLVIEDRGKLEPAPSRFDREGDLAARDKPLQPAAAHAFDV